MASEEKVMHEAYTVFAPPSLPVQIESLACYGLLLNIQLQRPSTIIHLKKKKTFFVIDNNVLLGTRQGDLLMYEVKQDPNERKMNLQLLQYDKNFSKKPITQIDVVPQYELLFSLTDNLIGIHHISRHNFPIVHSNPDTKGASLFALNVSRIVSLTDNVTFLIGLCVVVKRQLQFWFWKDNKLLKYRDAIQLDDTPKSVVWFENTICIGFKTDYVIYDVSKMAML